MQALMLVPLEKQLQHYFQQTTRVARHAADHQLNKLFSIFISCIDFTPAQVAFGLVSDLISYALDCKVLCPAPR